MKWAWNMHNEFIASHTLLPPRLRITLNEQPTPFQMGRRSVQQVCGDITNEQAVEEADMQLEEFSASKKPDQNVMICPWGMKTQPGTKWAVATAIKDEARGLVINIVLQKDDELLAALRARYAREGCQVTMSVDEQWPGGKKGVAYLIAVVEEAMRTTDSPDFPDIRAVIAQRVEKAAIICEHAQSRWRMRKNSDPTQSYNATGRYKR